MSVMISGIGSNAAQSLAAAGGKEPPQVRRTQADPPVPSRVPAADEYVPEEKQEPSGRYWPGRDGDGRPKVCFDDPEQADGGPSDAPKAERCTGSTDQVDREIERLKKRKETLEQQISSQTDDGRLRGADDMTDGKNPNRR